MANPRNELVEKLRQLLGMPDRVRAFKVEWAVDRLITVECEYMPGVEKKTTPAADGELVRCELADRCIYGQRHLCVHSKYHPLGDDCSGERCENTGVKCDCLPPREAESMASFEVIHLREKIKKWVHQLQSVGLDDDSSTAGTVCLEMMKELKL